MLLEFVQTLQLCGSIDVLERAPLTKREMTDDFKTMDSHKQQSTTLSGGVTFDDLSV